MFIDRTGRRGRLVTVTAAGIALACLGYLFFLSTLVAGLWHPVATAPPRVQDSAFPNTDEPRPAGSRGGDVRADSPRRSAGTGPGRPGEARPRGATAGAVR